MSAEKPPDSLLARGKPAQDDPIAAAMRRNLRQIIAAPEQPVRVGRYEILHRVGAGAMGVVYAARDPELQRRVALKVIAGGDARTARRVLREARAIARVAHPNVVIVYDTGEVEDAVYIAMELLDGKNLRQWLHAAAWTTADIIATFGAAGRGLAAAHAVQLVHGDFKPQNVLVAGPTVAPLVKVADFGLARFDDPDARVTSSAIDARAGTPAYMAPEQIDGKPADARSDQFAFCVALYEALWKTRPFAGANLAAMLEAVRAGRVRSPQPRADVPDGVRRAVLRGLERDPAARFPDMPALLAELDASQHRPRAGHKRRVIAVAIALASIGAATAVVVARTTAPADATAFADPPASAPRPVVGMGQPRDVAVPEPAAAATRSTSSSPSPPSPSAPSSTSRPPSAPTRSSPAPSRERSHVPPPIAADPPRAATAALPTEPLALVEEARRRLEARDGRGCVAALTELERRDRDVAARPEVALIRPQCLMLAGRCDEGRRLARSSLQSMFRGSEDEVDAQVDRWASLHCASGSRTDRDVLLHALGVLGDAALHPRTAAECATAYEAVKRLVPEVRPRGLGDPIADAPHAMRAYVPLCFARAGDCGAAWQAAKEIDRAVDPREPARARRTTVWSQRSAFASSVGTRCDDRDQGALDDVEVVVRAIDELARASQHGTPASSYCSVRIERAEAALRRRGQLPDGVETAPDALAREAARCRAAAAR